MLLPTTLVGSYPQPDWLIDRARLAKQVPRVRAHDLWLVEPGKLEAAQDDATLLAIRDQERAGIDIITDGEQRRESYSNRFANALEGIDLDRPGKTPNRTGGFSTVPRVVGAIRRRHAVQVRDLQFLRANTDRMVKMTVPGPFTMSAQCEDDFYRDARNLALAYARAVNAEIKDLFAAGADIVQIDEPWMQSRPQQAREYGIEALNAALDGVGGTTAVHICFGYAAVVKDKPSGYSFLPELERSAADQISIEAAQPKLEVSVLRELPSKTIILGVLDLSDLAVEMPATVAGRIRKALALLPPARVVVAPDCGLKISAAQCRLWKNAGDGGRRSHGAGGRCPCGNSTDVLELRWERASPRRFPCAPSRLLQSPVPHCLCPLSEHEPVHGAPITAIKAAVIAASTRSSSAAPRCQGSADFAPAIRSPAMHPSRVRVAATASRASDRKSKLTARSAARLQIAPRFVRRAGRRSRPTSTGPAGVVVIKQPAYDLARDVKAWNDQASDIAAEQAAWGALVRKHSG